MPISPARVAAFEVLLRVERESAYAMELLHASRHANLSATNHGLASELVMGVLRWRSRLDREITRHSSISLARLDSEVLTSLRLAIYQLMFLDRIPARAAIHDGVELVKQARKSSAAAFTNAVLRKLAKRGEKALAVEIPACQTSAQLSAQFAHPQWLVERWVREFGFDCAVKICNYDQQVPETTIRVTDPADEDELTREGVRLVPGRILSSARRAAIGNSTVTAAFRQGRVAFQDEASQLVSLLVGQGTTILDCCAAPGGKTRVLAQQNPSATILAVELHSHRARLLRKLVSAPNVRVVAADVRMLPLVAGFDRVLVDAPCSGTGTLARNPEIKWRLRIEDLTDLRDRQISILRSAMQRVSPKGRLVYATCSLEREENQNVVDSALSSDSSFKLLEAREYLETLRAQRELLWQDLTSLLIGPYLRTIPGVHPCDGFFAAILEKVS